MYFCLRDNSILLKEEGGENNHIYVYKSPVHRFGWFFVEVMN